MTSLRRGSKLSIDDVKFASFRKGMRSFGEHRGSKKHEFNGRCGGTEAENQNQLHANLMKAEEDNRRLMEKLHNAKKKQAIMQSECKKTSKELKEARSLRTCNVAKAWRDYDRLCTECQWHGSSQVDGLDGTPAAQSREENIPGYLKGEAKIVNRMVQRFERRVTGTCTLSSHCVPLRRDKHNGSKFA